MNTRNPATTSSTTCSSDAPQWELQVMSDDYEHYDCDAVLQGTLRDYVLQPGTLLFHELIAGRDAEIALDQWEQLGWEDRTQAVRDALVELG